MKTQCPNCKSKFNINETSVGKQAKCPKCTQPFTIEPFVETPAATLTAEHPTSPDGLRRAGAETAEKNNKINSAGAEVKNETPFVKTPVPAPVAKSPAPMATPIKKLATEDVSKAPNFMLGVNPQDKPGGLPVSAVESVSKTALSKTVFVYCWMGVRIIAGVLGALGLMLAIQKGAKSTLVATFAAADVFLICSVAIEYMLFYKMWAAIKDSQASISPGKAVGFLFIPVFNLYWALLMVTGFAEDYNAFILKRSIKAKSLPMSLCLIYAFAFMLSEAVLTPPMLCVFAFLRRIYGAFIDYTVSAWILLAFVSVAGIVHFITYILFAIKTCNAVNALPGKQGR